MRKTICGSFIQLLSVIKKLKNVKVSHDKNILYISELYKVNAIMILRVPNKAQEFIDLLSCWQSNVTSAVE